MTKEISRRALFGTLAGAAVAAAIKEDLVELPSTEAFHGPSPVATPPQFTEIIVCDGKGSRKSWISLKSLLDYYQKGDVLCVSPSISSQGTLAGNYLVSEVIPAKGAGSSSPAVIMLNELNQEDVEPGTVVPRIKVSRRPKAQQPWSFPKKGQRHNTARV